MQNTTALIGNNIRQWRELRNLKSEALAKQIGVSRVTLSSIENGKIDISISRLERIALVLRIPLKYVFYSPMQMIASGSNGHDLLNADNDHLLEPAISNVLLHMLREKQVKKNYIIEQLLEKLRDLPSSNEGEGIPVF
jgi:transcriptional regulator with XRE-family HTH domain